MRKILLNDSIDKMSVLSDYGNQWKQEINNVVTEYPCILIIADYLSDDNERTYIFDTLLITDFQNSNCKYF